MQEQTVSDVQLAEVLRTTNRSQKVGLTHRKPVDLYKKGNALWGRVEVVQTIRGHINANYGKLKKATGNEEAVQKRAWGVRVPGTPLVEYKDQAYIELKAEGVGKKTYLVDGLEVKDNNVLSEIQKYLKAKPQTEGTPIRDVPLKNVLRLKMGGTTYRVKR